MVNKAIHVLVYGKPTVGKSTFAATFPKPMLVLCCDPPVKASPYLKGGEAGPITPWNGVRFQEVRGEEGGMVTRVEYYFDSNPTEPKAFMLLQQRLSVLPTEVDQGKWATVVLDSATFAELAARKMYQHHLEAGVKDPRKWYAGSTSEIEEIVMIRLASLFCNVVVTAHVDEDKDELFGRFVYYPAFPGKLKCRVSSAYLETYHLNVSLDENGGRLRRLQTEVDDRYIASSDIGAPNQCEPTYDALWAGGNE